MIVYKAFGIHEKTVNTVAHEVHNGCQPSQRVYPSIIITSLNPPLLFQSEPPHRALLPHSPTPPYAAQRERPLRFFSLIEGETKIAAYFLVTHFLSSISSLWSYIICNCFLFPAPSGFTCPHTYKDTYAHTLTTNRLP